MFFPFSTYDYKDKVNYFDILILDFDGRKNTLSGKRRYTKNRFFI